MKLKTILPTTASQRGLIKINYKNLEKSPLLKSKIKGFKNTAGRNTSGKKTSYHKGGGHKQKYREINFNQNNYTGIVVSIEYDPNRTAHIASIYDYTKKNYNYIIAPENLKVGNIIKAGSDAEPKLGHSLPLSKIPVGSLLYNVFLRPNRSAQFSRSAGTFSYYLEKKARYGRIKLSSGKKKTISINCYASIGTVSNELHFLTTIAKAGRSRWLNKRPIVRGVAMNPIDHPHGGGEGKKSGKNLTPWGKSNKN